VGFVVDKVTLGQVFLPSSSVLSCHYIIPPLFHTLLSLPHEVGDSLDEAAHYHTLGPKLGASSLTQNLAITKEGSSIIF
jgi:hypothetical protein